MSDISEISKDTSDNNAALRTGASAQMLERQVDKYSGIGHFCALVVVIGVGLEYKEPFLQLLRQHNLLALKMLLRESAGGILVAIGVAGELLVGFLANRKDNELRSLNAMRVVSLGLKIAELNLLAEQERHSRAKLEHRLAPRLLSSEDRQILRDRLSRYRSQQFQIHVDTDNGECVNFAEEIRDCLTDECGWTGDMYGVASHTIASGVAVYFGKDDVQQIRSNLPTTYEVCRALREAIERTDIVLAENSWNDPNGVPKGVIAIDVGPKPLWG